MKLKFFYPLWGSANLPFDTFCAEVKNAGFDGVECDLPLNKDEKQERLSILKVHELDLIAQYYQSTAKDFDQHYREQEMHQRNLASAKPLFINSQTGKDYYTAEQNKKLIALSARIEQETGVAILHETHRGKFSFAAHITKNFLRDIPDIKLTLDISHWCAVHETLLHDQSAAVELAIQHTRHIHSRIGHTQGPQVNDPRAYEWQDAKAFHLDCWRKVALHHKKMNAPALHITTEFGPFPYLPSMPESLKPITAQWESNLYVMNLLKSTLTPLIAN